MSQRADRTRNLPHAHVFCRVFKPLDIAFRFGIPVRELESERRGLGMNAVGAADGRRVLEFEGSAFEDRLERFKIVAND